MKQDILRCEALVIGSGPGGSVTAATLASRGKDVMLMEEGQNLRLDSCRPFSLEEMRQKYRCGGLNPAVGSPRVPLVEGCCVGGGSEINSALYHRTPPEILGLWRERFEVRHLESEDLRPHFEANEATLAVQLSPDPAPGAAQKMKLGAERLGWRSLEVPRSFRYENPTGQNRRIVATKQSMTETFIPCALQAGCRLLAETRAERVRRERGRWQVTALHGRRLLTIDAEAVFLCGGAIESPALLRRSGIHRNVGNSLALHPTVKVVATFDEEINREDTDVPAEQVKEFSPEISMGCSISSLPYIAMAMMDHPDARVDVAANWRRMAVYYAMIAGPNHGTVRNLPFCAAPLIRYHLSDVDMRTLATALRYLCRLLFAAGATRLYPSILGFPGLQSESELTLIPDELPRRWTNLMTIHLFSSCPMGDALNCCATDSFGQVHEHKNLYVNDASLLCTAPGVNPQGTIMALARRNALHFSGGH
jgi:choline dehydrogenase-like flavoprotein